MIGRLFKIATVIAGLAVGGVVAVTRKLPPPEQKALTAEARRERAVGTRLKRVLKIAAVLIVLAVIGGLLVAASGIIPIKASSGHWAITRWFLQFSKQRSVVTHTIGMTAPRLDEPWLALKGAGHYETGCRPCHGSPALPQPRIARALTPPPPYLPQTLSRWEPEELFYIVKHGIKFTGMPAWPALERDDEVWAMVAFLRRFPQLNADEYRQMVSGEASLNREVAPLQDLLGPEHVPRAITVSCGRCHGVDGQGRGLGAFPRLAGQQAAYLNLSLQAYARGERHSGIMEPLVAGLSDEEISALASYYASLSRPSPPSSQPSSRADGPAIARGAVVAQQGIPGQRVPACAACHGPGDLPRNPAYPVLASQYADYLALQLKLFKQGQRGGTAYAHLMRQVAAGLNAEQMSDVARYYASLSPALDNPGAPGLVDGSRGAANQNLETKQQ